jgi:hypothetical protein
MVANGRGVPQPRYAQHLTTSLKRETAYASCCINHSMKKMNEREGEFYIYIFLKSNLKTNFIKYMQSLTYVRDSFLETATYIEVMHMGTHSIFGCTYCLK